VKFVAVFLSGDVVNVKAVLVSLAIIFSLSGCGYKASHSDAVITVTDQLGRVVSVPRNLTRIAALHHFGGRIVFALGQRHRLVEQSLYGREAAALAKVDREFDAMPKTQAQTGHAINYESLIALRPQCIFVGSSLSTYGVQEVLNNSQFKALRAVKTGKVYVFPSNIGWWDYPAPQCVLGVLWTAKTLYPELFKDIDVLKIADDHYAKYLGHTFTSMGGRQALAVPIHKGFLATDWHERRKRFEQDKFSKIA
jgi:ABC-type Fe3+-hydroxamate transport system substrate-binding protein